MTVSKKPIRTNLTPDDAPELTLDLIRRAQISRGGKIIRKATGTLAKRGRPPIGDHPKEQVTLRLPSEVIAYFKADGPGWQTRLSDVLERYATKDKRKRAETH